jgi:hypothetical protein
MDKQAFVSKMLQVAQWLEPGWRARQTNEQCVAFTREADGASFYAYLQTHPKPHAHVKGNYIEGIHIKTYGEQDPSINVSATRTPQSIANDITRRFLPGYLPVYEKELEQKRRVDRHTAWKVDRLRAIAGYVFGEVDRENLCVKILDENGKQIGTIRLYSLDGPGDAEPRVNLELDEMSWDRGVYLLMSLKEHIDACKAV